MWNVHLLVVKRQGAFRQPHKLFVDLEPVVVRVPVVSHDLCRSNDILSVTRSDVIAHLKLSFPWQDIPPDTA